MIAIGIKPNGTIEEFLKGTMHLYIVLASHYIVIGLPVPDFAKVSLYLLLFLNGLAYIFNQLYFVNDFNVLWLLKESNGLRLDLDRLVKVLLVEGVIFIVVLAIGDRETVVPGLRMKLIEFSLFLSR